METMTVRELMLFLDKQDPEQYIVFKTHTEIPRYMLIDKVSHPASEELDALVIVLKYAQKKECNHKHEMTEEELLRFQKKQIENKLLKMSRAKRLRIQKEIAKKAKDKRSDAQNLIYEVMGEAGLKKHPGKQKKKQP